MGRAHEGRVSKQKKEISDTWFMGRVDGGKVDHVWMTQDDRRSGKHAWQFPHVLWITCFNMSLVS